MTTARSTDDAALAAAADDVWPRRLTWLRRWLALSWLGILAATWRLWTPQTVFPQIPFLAALRTAPAWIDWLALTALLIGLIALLALPVSRRRSPPAAAGGADTPAPLSLGRGAGGEGVPSTPFARQRLLQAPALLAIISTTLLVLLDQHRFQPWAYQFVIVAIVLAFTPAVPAASLLRVLTVGIYFWSAVSKLDYIFLHTMGAQLLEGFYRAFGAKEFTIDHSKAAMFAWAFPIDELAVALLLSIRRTRTIGLVLSIVMHALLLAALGPLGLDHSLGVLLWNVYFIGQNLLLFRRPALGWRRTAGPGLWLRIREIARGFVPPYASAGLGHAAVFLAVWLPALEPVGLLDHWPGWAVYSPSAEKVLLVVPREVGKSRGFDEWEDHYFGADFGAPWQLRDDLWSLQTLSAPVSPHGRFRVGVALAAIERHELHEAATLMVVGRADRFTGKRSVGAADSFTGKGSSPYPHGESEVRAYAASFHLNALPRHLGGW